LNSLLLTHYLRDKEMNSFEIDKKRILVVEDEPAIRDVCRRVLTVEGFEVDIAENGQVAQEMIAKNEYTLYLIDIRTPIIDGEELYIWLLQEYANMTSRVIFTTGDMMGGDTTSFIEQTNRLFLPKPFSPDELKKVVREALSR
jgi:DNA-binding response OmpR family regulator